MRTVIGFLFLGAGICLLLWRIPISLSVARRSSVRRFLKKFMRGGKWFRM